MNETAAVNHRGLSRLKLFLALSRTPHGLLDMATPALGALLWLGGAPSPAVVLLGFLTAFAGYTAVYALNDVVDYRADREKVRAVDINRPGTDLDAVFVRHPLAQGLLSFREGVLWTAAWGSIALIGAYVLNPACALVFVAGCVAEAVYCLMLRISYLRTVVSGAVKTAGGMAAVLAVVPDPSWLFMCSLFLCLFCWEVGGQNVPNDWCDADEDRCLDAETIPVRFGREGSARIILVALAMAVVLSVFLFWATPARLSPLYIPGAIAAGVFLLFIPAYHLYKSGLPRHASILFNRASYYPLTLLVVVLLSSII